MDSRMSKPKRTKAQRLEDFTFISRLYVQGKTQRAIVEELAKVRDYTLSQAMIGKEIKKIMGDWLEYRNQKIDKHVADALMRIDAVEREGWDSWLKSKQPKKTTRVRVKGTPTGQQAGAPIAINESEKSTTAEERPGDPRYMTIVQWAVDQRCRVLGTYAAFKADLGIADGSPIHVALSMTHEDRVRRLSSLLSKATRHAGESLIDQIKGYKDGGNGSDRSGAN